MFARARSRHPRTQQRCIHPSLLLIALLVLSMLLAACGGDDDDDNGDAVSSPTTTAPTPTMAPEPAATDTAAPEPATSTTAAEAPATATTGSTATSEGTATTPASAAQEVTMTGANGEVTFVPTSDNVWALDYATALELLALGVTPTHAGRDPYEGDAIVAAAYEILETAGVELVAPNDVELVAAGNPDLILGINYRGFEEVLPQLEQIAPVLLTNDQLSWDTHMRELGQATGQDVRAAELIDFLQTAIDALAARIADSPHAGASVSIISACGDVICTYGTARIFGSIITQLGFERIASQANSGNQWGYEMISMEDIGSQVADIIISFGGSVTFGAPSPFTNELFDTSNSITAEVDFGAWYGTGTMHVLWILHDLKAILFDEGSIATQADGAVIWGQLP